MGTAAGAFRDIIFSTTQAGNLRAWFQALDPQWRGWDYDAQWFAEGVVGAMVFGAGADRLAYLRMLQTDFDELVSRNPPGALFDVYAQADPYDDISDLDPEAPDYRAQVLARRSVVWKIKSNPAKVARVREFWPRQVPVYDENGQQIGLREVGLRFADFGEGFDDVAGDGE